MTVRQSLHKPSEPLAPQFYKKPLKPKHLSVSKPILSPVSLCLPARLVAPLLGFAFVFVGFCLWHYSSGPRVRPLLPPLPDTVPRHDLGDLHAIDAHLVHAESGVKAARAEIDRLFRPSPGVPLAHALTVHLFSLEELVRDLETTKRDITQAQEKLRRRSGGKGEDG